MPAELIAPALACGNAVVWTPAPSTAVCAVALAALHRRRRPAARACSTSSPVPARWSATRSPATPASTASRSSAPPPPADSLRRPRPARPRCWRWAATARWCVLDDGDVDGRRRGDADRLLPVRGPELHGGRAHPRAPRGATTSSSRSWPARSPSRSCSATRSTTRRRWARSTTSRWRPRWTSTSPTRWSAAPSVVPAAPAPTALPHRPLLGAHGARRRAGRRPRGHRGDVRPGRPGRGDHLARGRDHADQCGPYGLLAAIFTADLARGLEFADRVAPAG